MLVVQLSSIVSSLFLRCSIFFLFASSSFQYTNVPVRFTMCTTIFRFTSFTQLFGSFSCDATFYVLFLLLLLLLRSNTEVSHNEHVKLFLLLFCCCCCCFCFVLLCLSVLLFIHHQLHSITFTVAPHYTVLQLSIGIDSDSEN